MMNRSGSPSNDRFGAPPDRADQGRAAADRMDLGEDTDKAAGVLIVEDDFLIAMQTESALTDAGFHVVGIATTAEEAIGLTREHRPQIAVMDIRLAGRRDGIEAAGELFLNFGVRCVFATAHDDQRTRERAQPFAPLGWLAKPYTMASLIALVRQAISS
jgi:DNA-binding NarL/FixJ family response regulator